MASFRLAGAACAVSLTLLSTAATAQVAPVRSPATTLWYLRSGLNVAALACRGPQDDTIVAGYNRLLTDHGDELAVAYQTVSAEHGSPAAFDAVMTSLYNRFAAPAGQAGLCDTARIILDEATARGNAPLAELAAPGLAMLEAAFNAPPPLPPVAIAMASAPQLLTDADPEY